MLTECETASHNVTPLRCVTQACNSMHTLEGIMIMCNSYHIPHCHQVCQLHPSAIPLPVIKCRRAYALFQHVALVDIRHAPVHQPRKEGQASFGDIVLRLSSKSSSILLAEPGVHGVFFRLYAGKIYPRELLLSFRQTAPCITSGYA